MPWGNRHVSLGETCEIILAALTPAGYKDIGGARVPGPVQATRGWHAVRSNPTFVVACVHAKFGNASVFPS
jgi:hypothetical protein